MGLDGVVYAALSLNLANTSSGIWLIPHFDAASGAFLDHPPLGIWLQSLWFQIFGDAFWVERLYCMVAFALVCALLLLAWRRLNQGSSVGAHWVLALFLLMPVVTRTAKNNLLELPLTIVTLAAVICAWEGRKYSPMSLLVGIFVAIGVLIKGPVALFPLAAPFVFAVIVDRRLCHGIAQSSLAGLTCAAIITGVLLSESAGETLSRYLHQQILASLSGERPALHGRLYLLSQIGINLLPPVLLTLFLAIRQRQGIVSRQALAWIAVGLTASIPLLISPRQFRHYLFPSLPYFALAAAMIARPTAALPVRWVQVSAALVLIAALLRGTLNFAEPGKDAALLLELSEVAAEAQAVGQRRIGFCEPEPTRQSYLVRYYGLETESGRSKAEWQICASPPGLSFTLQRTLSDGLFLWYEEAAQRYSLL